MSAPVLRLSAWLAAHASYRNSSPGLSHRRHCRQPARIGAPNIGGCAFDWRSRKCFLCDGLAACA